MKYTCPNCEEEQTSIIEWVLASVAFEYEDIKIGDRTEKSGQKVDIVLGERTSIACPSCGEELDASFDHFLT